MTFGSISSVFEPFTKKKYQQKSCKLSCRCLSICLSNSQKFQNLVDSNTTLSWLKIFFSNYLMFDTLFICQSHMKSVVMAWYRKHGIDPRAHSWHYVSTYESDHSRLKQKTSMNEFERRFFFLLLFSLHFKNKSPTKMKEKINQNTWVTKSEQEKKRNWRFHTVD